MATAHVPAWKRLGLKLKHAKEISGSPGSVNESKADREGLKRKSASSHWDESSATTILTPTKKAKKTEDWSARAPSTPLAIATLSEDLSDNSVVPVPAPSATKRKSVSFTPETKIKDGEGAKQLYAAWLAQQPADFNPTTATEALREVTPATISDSAERPKLKKQKQAKTTHSSTESPVTSSESAKATAILPTLQYLHSYHTSREAWKFNKSKQNQIFKHAFDTTKIPLDHDDALAAYMSGLASTAARKRMRDQAFEIRKEDKDVEGEADEEDKEESTDDGKMDIEAEEEEEMAAKAARRASRATQRTSEPRQKQYYRHALHQYKQELRGLEFEREEREKLLDTAWRRRLLQRKRAELVLWSVGEHDPTADVAAHTTASPLTGTAHPPKPDLTCLTRPGTVHTVTEIHANGNGASTKLTPKQNGAGAVVKRKRKRKRRTGVPDDDSSSSESSSSSSSSSNSDNSDNSDEDAYDERPLAKALAKELGVEVAPGSGVGSSSEEGEDSEDSSSGSGSGSGSGSSSSGSGSGSDGAGDDA
ncbi:hypothetical protein MMC19_006480 [Ptychographa xylographoides]|nr:hypothetical protein [Ptychographa xylographoides]